ncbi:MAG: RecX family transcriptional regulator [Rhodospirillaceae bacterium]|nr:RecX family transcriptional regulator [Rhodospirillaceae bacterium]
MTEEPETRRPKKKPKVPRKVTRSSLENAALYYLERFATSVENMRRVLYRRVDKSARHHETDPEEGRALVDDLIRRYVASGLLDDRVYANAQAITMHRRGKSTRAIRAWLMQKAASGEAIDQALENLAEDAVDPDLAAAIRHARRRRLGPYRTRQADEKTRDKELASLARAGFSYGIARRVIDAKDINELEEDADTA